MFWKVTIVNDAGETHGFVCEAEPFSLWTSFKSTFAPPLGWRASTAVHAMRVTGPYETSDAASAETPLGGEWDSSGAGMLLTLFRAAERHFTDSAKAPGALKPEPKQQPEPPEKKQPKPKPKPKFFHPNGTEYVPRVIDKDSGCTDVEFVDAQLRIGHHLLISGSPGCGKTFLLETVVGLGIEKANAESGLDRSSIAVIASMDENRRVVYSPGPLLRAATHVHSKACPKRCGRATFYLDEVNAADPTSLILINEFLDGSGSGIVLIPEFKCPDESCSLNEERRAAGKDPVGHIHLSPDFRFVASYNPDLAGGVIASSLQSRCRSWVMETRYDVLKGRVDDKTILWAEHLKAQRDGGVRVNRLPSARDLLAWQAEADALTPGIAWSMLMNKADHGSLPLWQEAANMQVLGYVPEPLVMK